MAHGGQKFAFGFGGRLRFFFGLSEMFFHRFLSGKVSHKGIKKQGVVLFKRNNGQFDWKFLPVPMQCGHLQALVQELADFGVHKPSQSLLVSGTMLFRHNGVGQRFSQNLFFGPSKKVSGLGIPSGDPTFGIHPDDSIQTGGNQVLSMIFNIFNAALAGLDEVFMKLPHFL